MPRRRKPGVGRPALPAGDKRGRLISVRTTESLGERIDSAAEREERSVSDWMVAAAELALERGSTR